MHRVARPRRRSLQTAWRNPGEFWAIAVGLPYPSAQHDLQVRSVRAGSRRRRAAGGRQGREPRAAGVRAARAAGREQRAAGLEGRDHREGLGRPRRHGRGGGEPREVGAAGARRRRQVAAIHQDDPRPGLSVRRAGQSVRAARRPRLAAGARATTPILSWQTWFSAWTGCPGPSLAVLPFRFVAGDERYAALASALPDELIADLARLRWLFVTARGSSFRLRAPDADFGDIGRLLGVRYCLSGTIEASADSLVVIVELVDTGDGGVVWADRFAGRVDDVHAMREQIRSQVLAALEIRIPLHEASLARLAAGRESRRVVRLPSRPAAPVSLQSRRQRRRHRAVPAGGRSSIRRLRARTRGCRSCTSRAAFMHYTDDIAGAIGQARRFAERGLELDPLDPFVNFTMGRTYWLEGDLETSLGWLERATDISPHYAQGIYARAWTEALAGRAVGCAAARRSGDAPESARSAALRDARHARVHAHGFGRGRASRALGRARRALARSARADRDDCGGRAHAGGRHRACGLLGGERARAERLRSLARISSGRFR